jgi:hypothetical protein
VLNIQKTLNQNRVADKLSVEVSRFVMMIAWFVTKYVGVMCCFLQNKKKKKKKWGRRRGRSYVKI